MLVNHIHVCELEQIKLWYIVFKPQILDETQMQSCCGLTVGLAFRNWEMGTGISQAGFLVVGSVISLQQEWALVVK